MGIIDTIREVIRTWKENKESGSSYIGYLLVEALNKLEKYSEKE